jgi:Predicted metal-binding protein (DUF2103).
MKYRRYKIKREHGIIQNGLDWLEDLGENQEVTDIIPGVIEISRSPERGIIYKYETATGCKLLLKSNGSIQEVFVVTKEPQWVRKWVEDHFPPVKHNLPAKPVKRFAENNVKDPFSTKGSPQLLSSRKSNRQRGGSKKIPSDFIRTFQAESEPDDLCLGDRLEKDTYQALRTLQNELKILALKKKKKSPEI